MLLYWFDDPDSIRIGREIFKRIFDIPPWKEMEHGRRFCGARTSGTDWRG
jgi:hypothetical protein